MQVIVALKKNALSSSAVNGPANSKVQTTH
jgi:hypothetical protein